MLTFVIAGIHTTYVLQKPRHAVGYFDVNLGSIVLFFLEFLRTFYIVTLDKMLVV